VRIVLVAFALPFLRLDERNKLKHLWIEGCYFDEPTIKERLFIK